MKVLNSKVMSFEQDTVEYSSYEEYMKDLDKRRKEGWTRERRPDWYNCSMEVIEKYNNDKIIVRYKRYDRLSFG